MRVNPRFLWLFVPFCGFLVILILLGYQYHVDTLYQRLVNRNTCSLEAKKIFLQVFLSSAVSDIFYIGNSDIPTRLIKRPDSNSAAYRDLTLFSEAARRYDQLRILDTTGLEFIRINYENERAIIIPKEELQDKAHRFYMQDAPELDSGEMYISPIDLNVEYKQVEYPHKPVIRLIMEIEDGQSKGYLVGNILLKKFFKDLAVVDSISATSFMLLNGNGYWLKSPETYPSFAFMFEDKQEENMGRYFPEAWGYIQANEKGAFYDEKGLFVFEKVNFIDLLEDIPALAPNEYLVRDENNFILATYTDPEILRGVIQQDRSILYTVLLGIILITALLAWVRARAVHKDVLAKQRLKEKKIKLQKLVNQLSSRNLQLKEFNRIVSHNLRSPVNNLNLLLDLFQQSDEENEKELTMKNLVAVSGSLQRLVVDLGETLNVLDGDDLRSEDCSLTKTLEKIKNLVNVEVERTRGVIHSDFSAWDLIHYPALYLESLLLNLITNAIKYRSPGRPPIIHITSFYKNGYKALSVADNGSGIDLEIHGHDVFKLHKRFHPNKPGKGIGLFMTKSQTESLGGSLEVASEKGKGSVFTVIFDDPL
ncbi:ATP-binding protein [Roseivirga sp. BDSF3-8]|uniref:sensor histidine kinase n=1 Tax=Roseivirga sp. BDSF3-8 TaxID=3241598 RepID=UPI0035318DAF